MVAQTSFKLLVFIISLLGIYSRVTGTDSDEGMKMGDVLKVGTDLSHILLLLFSSMW